MTRALLRLLRDERGATAIEYGLIAGLIALVLITAFIGFGASLGNLFGYVSNHAIPVFNSAGS